MKNWPWGGGVERKGGGGRMPVDLWKINRKLFMRPSKISLPSGPKLSSHFPCNWQDWIFTRNMAQPQNNVRSFQKRRDEKVQKLIKIWAKQKNGWALKQRNLTHWKHNISELQPSLNQVNRGTRKEWEWMEVCVFKVQLWQEIKGYFMDIKILNHDRVLKLAVIANLGGFEPDKLFYMVDVPCKFHSRYGASSSFSADNPTLACSPDLSLVSRNTCISQAS